jgi:predicted site-specific integrase-resolvase
LPDERLEIFASKVVFGQAQTEELQQYCKEKNEERIEVIEDIGSGINYRKRGLKKLIGKIIQGKVKK